MKKLFSLLRKAPKRTAAVLAIIAAVIIVPAVSFAWGPDRPTYTIEHPADHVTFNSITNNPSHGDERNFVQVRDANSGNESYVDQIGLTAGHEYVVYVYYHNNAASNLNASGVGIAYGAYVKAQIPAVVTNGSTDTKAVGYVGASNATPSEVWDDISFSNTTGGDIALRYVPGSATIHNFGATNGATMSDSIVTTGTALGYNSLDGVLPGCNEYSGYVTFRVKADQPNFTVTKQVRKTGTTSWSENVAVNPGDSVDYLITYKNTGTTTQNDVVISDDLPNGTSYINGTTYLANTTNPSGIRVSDNVTNNGINIGNYSAGAAAYVKFSAKVAYNYDLPTCGTNTLINTATAQTNNGSKSDTAIVYTVKQCDNPNPNDQPNFTITKQVRKTGTTDWNENIAVNPGDSVDYLITYRNTGNTTLYNVNISDTLPSNVSYIAGTTYVNDAKTNDSIVNGGINIGNYTAGSIAYLRFSALVASNDALSTCGNNTLTNTASAQTSNGSKSDTAIVTVVKQCATTTPTAPSELPHTGAGLDITAILGLGATVTSAGYYIASRRLLKR